MIPSRQLRPEIWRLCYARSLKLTEGGEDGVRKGM